MGGRARGGGFWVLIAFAAIGYWVFGQTRGQVERRDRVADESRQTTDDADQSHDAATDPATSSGETPAVERDERAYDERTRRAALEVERGGADASAPTSIAIANERDDCVLSSGPFALPDGTRSVDWKVVNRSAHDVEIDVTVYRLRIGEAAEIVAPGAIRKTLAPGHETHNANSVGDDKPFPPGSDFEVVVRRSDRAALPSLSFWSTHGNNEIPGTRIGPRDFVAVGGDCGTSAAHD